MNTEQIFREAEAVHIALGDARAFSQRYLSGGSAKTDVFGWYEEADKVIWHQSGNGERSFHVILVPPGWGKTRGYTVLESARRIAHDRTHRVGLFSKSRSKAENYMGGIRAILEKNQKLIQDCGTFIDNSVVANTEKINVLGHPEGETTPSITNMGITSQVESLRFHTMIIDDPIDRETAHSEAEVEHFISRMKQTFIPRLEPGGQMIVIGSRFSQMDGYHWFLKNPLFAGNSFVLPAIDEVGETTCPERFSTGDLERIKAGLEETDEGDRVESTSDWEARYMQRPMAGSEMAFKIDWIGESLNPDKWVAETPQSIHCGVDPAYSTAKTADYTGCVAIGFIGDNPVLCDVMATRISSGFVENIKEFRSRAGGTKLLVEVNNARTLGDDLRSEGEPARDVVQTTGKIMRIGDLEHWFRKDKDQGGLLFHKGLLENPDWGRFIREYIYFPNARHEHMLDALEFTLRHTQKGRPGFVDPSGLFGA